MFAFLRRPAFWITLLALPVLIGVAAVAVWPWINQRLTKYVESAAFREALGKETSEGLHLGKGGFADIRRTGTWTAASDRFEGSGGWKAITSMTARGITTQFNPWGILRRQWELDYVHIDSGEVGIQRYEPEPEPVKLKPWHAIFLPDRIYLKRVVCEPADVTWQLRGETGGFFDTHLLITPNGRNFEYRAEGGTLRMALIPNLDLVDTHLLITRERLTLYELNLRPKDHPKGRLHVEGFAGLGDDKSVDARANFEGLPLRPWLPEAWERYVSGLASGWVHWQGADLEIESAKGTGLLRIVGGSIAAAPFLEELAFLTGQPSLDTLTLDTCSLELDWNYPHFEFRNIETGESGVFQIRGTVGISDGNLSGRLEFGVARPYLRWLPDAESKVFTREAGGYLWTAVEISGTLRNPREDLTPRIEAAIKDSPGAMVGLFFRKVGEWFKETFRAP